MTEADTEPRRQRHDRALYEELLATLRLIEPHVRTGSMFGCPAVYCGRKLAACVHGTAVGMRVPASTAAQALKRGQAVPFQPHGMAPMKEWIQIDGSALPEATDLLAAAVSFAAANNAARGRKR